MVAPAITSFENLTGELAFHFPGKVNLNIICTDAEAVQGTGSARLGDASTFAGSSDFKTLTVVSWSDTDVEVSIPEDISPITLGQSWLYLTNNTGDSNASGFECDVDLEWGMRFAGGSASNINYTRAMSGTSPNVLGMRLDKIFIRVDTTHTSQARLAVLQGGSLSTGPATSTLKEDVGLTSGSATNQFISVDSVNNPYMTPNAVTWAAYKGNDSGFNIDGNNQNSGHDFQAANGRWNSGGEVSSDESVAYPSTWPTDTGSFGGFYYGIYWSYLLSWAGGLRNGVDHSTIKKMNGIDVTSIGTVNGVG